MNNPLISVVLCTYNGGRFIDEQLNSILNQTYIHLEIIISDDFSSDNTYEILKKHVEKDKRIRLFRNEKNIGFNLNFKEACSKASGELIAFADQDDIWLPEKLERMIAGWKGNVPLMYCNSVRFADKQPPVKVRHYPGYRRFEGTDSRKLSVFNTVSGHAMIIKKNLLQMTPVFLPGIFYDWQLAAIAACNGGVGYIEDILVFQRVHDSNITIRERFDPKSKESKLLFSQMVEQHLAAFSSIPNMPVAHVQYFSRLISLWSSGANKKFSWPLFFFLFKNRKLVFNYKKRIFSFFSHLKHCYRLTANY
ncbi:MAG: glycosyltransferase [Chitinophagaceae bacterium]|nr:glycosyltransferase [Chitinophagaceae bacterium]